MNLYPRNSRRAWVGLSQPAAHMVISGVTVLESEDRYEITVPLGEAEPGDVAVELVDHMLVISAKSDSAPSEDLDDIYAGERLMPLTQYVMVDRDLDPDSISGVYLGGALVISARKRRA